MKNRNFITLFFLWITAFNMAAYAQDGEIKPGERFRSPDGNFTAEFTDGGDSPTAEEAIIITDNRTGKVYPNIPTISPVLSIKWTGDSKAFMKIVHIANGSVAGAFYYESGRWIPYNTAPKIGEGYEVVRQVLKEHSIELAYKVFDRSHDNSAPKYRLYTFEFQPATGKRINEKVKAIDRDEYRRLKLTSETK